ncbi:hypothetical protein CN996_19240 [Bacillus cereus]|uniref:hypothetical protein n=1 Tax=Bacillus wiedmannii TaxID=1890302 RepID=UPI000BF2C54D|nr:hypothetical protein [Bacillus wiedmannii]PFI36186.1 hypothetical protein COI72_19790 [Bacillus cereus]PFX60228.1 hypothetical protein COL36_13150 [Bacillus wiedmannii]PGL39048.1 hypothetical protein CN930_11970 [Bacillus cereus]PGP00899.1 hypothetical protein CN996_19240 [Bacillus cereus]
MNENRIKELQKDQRSLVLQLRLIGKYAESDADFELEEEIEKSLEENRQELFKLTGEDRYHDKPAIRNLWSHVSFWVEERAKEFVCNASKEELYQKYDEYLEKCKGPERYDELPIFDEDDMKERLVSLIYKVKLEELSKASRI